MITLDTKGLDIETWKQLARIKFAELEKEIKTIHGEIVNLILVQAKLEKRLTDALKVIDQKNQTLNRIKKLNR